MEGRLLRPVPEEEKRTLRRRPPPPKAAPWLVFPVGKGRKDQNFINLSEPHNKIYFKSIPELSKTCYWQSNSHRGWLIILMTDPSYHFSNWKFGDCFLWNPESLETIELPNLLKWVKGSDYHGVYGFVLSSPPTNSDSMVYLILNKTKNLMFCRPGKDTKWRFEELPFEDEMVLNSQRSSIICIEGKLHIPYHFDDEYLHLVVVKFFDLDDDDDGGSSGGESFFMMLFDVSINSEDSTLGMFSAVYCLRDYVESSNEIFMIMKYFKKYDSTEILDFKVFKMNFYVMEWELVHNLGDHVLFLGERTTASCSAIELGLTSGCIYYTQSPHNILYKFEPERQRISVCLSCSNLTSPWFCPYWMSMPTNFRVAERRREVHMVGNDKGEDLVIGTKAEETNRKQTGAWAMLDENVLLLIANYLHAADYLHFRAVSKENRLAIPLVKSGTSSTDILHDALPPWLVFSRNNDTIYNFIDPMFNNQRYLMNVPELLDSTIRFSKGGWLLMSRGENSFFFFNPFTRAIIQLPDLPESVRKDTVAGGSFSSLPTSSDCKVCALTLVRVWTTMFVHVLTISRGDAAWHQDIVPNNATLRMEFLPNISNPVFYDGNLYYLDCNGMLGVYFLENYSWKLLGKFQRPYNSIYQCYLVECEGKLLSVFVGYSGKWVRVFRLDWKEEKVWVEVESLQKNMLFISRTSCLSVIAPDISMANRIYFSRFHDEKIIYFSLDTGMYHSVGGQHSAQDFTDCEEQLYTSWIEPSWSKNTVQELNWLDKLSEHGVENAVTANNPWLDW